MPGLWRVIRTFWPWIRREKPLMAGSMLALLAGVLLKLAEPWPLKFVLDRLIPTDRAEGANFLPSIANLNPMALLTLCAAAVVVISGLRALSDYHQRIGLAKIGIRVLRQVRNRVYIHLQGLSLSFHNKARTGDLVVRVTRDVSMLRDVSGTAMLPLAANSLVIVGMLTVMSLMQWRLALVALATVPLFWFSTIRLGRGIQQAARKQRAREGDMAATAAESMTAIREVQALSMEDAFADDFASRNSLAQKEDLKAARLSAKLGRTVDLLQALAHALVLWYGTVRVLAGAMTPGDLLVFLTYQRRLFRPAKDFAKYTGRLAKAAAAGERVVTLLDQAPEVRDRPGAVPAPPFRGEIRFDQVGFAYVPDHPVLEGIDLHVQPGRLVVLTGPSGSGKSTLFSLLLRLYDPTAGGVLIDGKDIRQYTLASLRPQVNVVLQDTILFSGTVRENIACSAPEATPEQLEGAARVANADEFIRALPDGYDTVIGERGATLSQGQRQRIALARAALHDRPRSWRLTI
jgi:ATP-binding cassette subfamily B protein